jgi:hypothetical protein
MNALLRAMFPLWIHRPNLGKFCPSQGVFMFERFWLWAGKSRWRLRASLFVIGAGNAVAFFWHYHRSPIFAFFDALFAIVFLGASIWSLLSGTAP